MQFDIPITSYSLLSKWDTAALFDSDEASSMALRALGGVVMTWPETERYILAFSVQYEGHHASVVVAVKDIPDERQDAITNLLASWSGRVVTPPSSVVSALLEHTLSEGGYGTGLHPVHKSLLISRDTGEIYATYDGDVHQ